MQAPVRSLCRDVALAALAWISLCLPAGATIYKNLDDPGCVYWEAKEPWTAFAVNATSATAYCIESAKVYIPGIGVTQVNRTPLVATVKLWHRSRGSRKYSIAAAKSFPNRGNCQTYPVESVADVYIDPWSPHVLEARLCWFTDMFVRTKVFPKPGCYHAEVEVHGVPRPPDLLNGTLLDDGNSAERCF